MKVLKSAAAAFHVTCQVDFRNTKPINTHQTPHTGNHNHHHNLMPLLTHCPITHLTIYPIYTFTTNTELDSSISVSVPLTDEEGIAISIIGWICTERYSCLYLV
ncbi:hypothetical protein E2C01_024157 [Portunus trituberculatus]|uniref:Uncharacterized protein n=1 Tax=Portunus trituberculatus TaxID=210409 RepID=A0A5B7EBZ4_PORTR|nr:hypothetical protein [Portunus trituberculatus]